MEYHVYMLQCSDNSFYIGVTNDVDRRLHEHVTGTSADAYTFKRRPVTLVYSATFSEVQDAISWEKQIKRWSKAKKKALMKGQEEILIALAKRRGGKPKK